MRKEYKKMSDFEKAWSWIRFGSRGDWVENEGRKIIRVTDFINTVSPACNCFENDKYVKTIYGREAINWVLGKENE